MREQSLSQYKYFIDLRLEYIFSLYLFIYFFQVNFKYTDFFTECAARIKNCATIEFRVHIETNYVYTDAVENCGDFAIAGEAL